MSGGPSQFELFDEKPKLQQLDGQPVPASYLKGKRFAFMDLFLKEPPRLLGTRRTFRRHGRSGIVVSDCLPYLAEVVDELSVVHSLSTDNINHAPAVLFANTGTAQFGRPSMGSWITYGLGTEMSNLPGFVVLQSGATAIASGAINWGAGFLPSRFQGVPFQPGPSPILDLQSPAWIGDEEQQLAVNAINELNRLHAAETGDPEIGTRIAAYETACRMQQVAPGIVDLSREDRRTLDLYGAEPGKANSFANNCLLARRLVECGVRFIQLYHGGWDHHGTAGGTLNEDLERVCLQTDQPCAALIKDLKQRGLLDSTLVVWGGEFGRTPMGEVRKLATGRNHHIDAFTMWLAGGGIKPGYELGATDELGFEAIEDKVHMHDLHATILHLLGLDHQRLTYSHLGREFRLTDVSGNVIEDLLA